MVDHNKQCNHCSDGYYGATNDQTIARNDPYIRSVMNGLYAGVCFLIFLVGGALCLVKGAYLIIDGGYPKNANLVNPLSELVDENSIRWSEWLESTRKDVECFFGVLEIRWRMLKNPIQYHDMRSITNLMKTCCVIHNMLLMYDGLSLDAWETGVNWDRLNPDDDANDESDEDIEEVDESEDTERISQVRSTTNSLLIMSEDELPIGVAHILSMADRSNSLRFRVMLSKSFAEQYKAGLVSWPRAFNSRQRQLATIQQMRVQLRVQLEMGIHCLRLQTENICDNEVDE